MKKPPRMQNYSGVALDVPGYHQGRIVTERIACRRLTRELPVPNRKVEVEKIKYRRYLLDRLTLGDSGCASTTTPSAALAQDNRLDTETGCGCLFGEDDGIGASSDDIEKFLVLVATIDSAKAVAFADLVITKSLLQAHAKTLLTDFSDDPDISYEKSTFLGHNTYLLHQERDQDPCIHPLFILLLAYRMGGPINAANTAYAHRWKAPQNSDQNPVDLVHTEGDTGDIMEDQRLTLAWEMRDSKAQKPSGVHDIFPSGVVELKELAFIGTQDENASKEKADGPVAILYDAKHAACCYTCQDPDAVRDSITFDFRVCHMSDLETALFSPVLAESELESMTLVQLLITLPIRDYTEHFHRLLFSPASLSHILSKLSSLDIPPVLPPAPAQPSPASSEQRYHAWERENMASIPGSIRQNRETHLTGLYPRKGSFIENIVRKAGRSVHFSLGLDFFPLALDGEVRIMEDARKWFRDLSAVAISHILMPYMPVVLAAPFALTDLLPVSLLANVSHRLSTIALSISSSTTLPLSPNSRYPAFLIPSIASFTAALATAFSSPLETDSVSEPWIDDTDLRTFGSRCLYTFYCADWLAGYLWCVESQHQLVASAGRAGLRTVGGGMRHVMAMVDGIEVGKARRWVRRSAGRLLRNWLAWVLFVEGLPGRPFRVRRS